METTYEDHDIFTDDNEFDPDDYEILEDDICPVCGGDIQIIDHLGEYERHEYGLDEDDTVVRYICFSCGWDAHVSENTGAILSGAVSN